MKFFRRKDDDNSFSVIDELGEWLIIRRNPNTTLIKSIVEKTMKKLKVKNWDLNLLYYIEDEKIKELFSIKAMLCLQDHVTELDFSNAFKNSLSNNLTLGQMRVIRVRACNITFLFFSTDLLLKRPQKVEEDPVKMLLPPKGAYGYEIPYTMKDLFIKMTERTLDTSCSSVSLNLNNGNFESVYQCRVSKNMDPDLLKESFSYFSYEEPNIVFKTASSRNVEIQLSIPKFRTKYLIPLLWGNIIASNIIC